MPLWLPLLFAIRALATWQGHDVSILLPLPKSGEESRMLSPTPELLPRDLFDALPNIVMKPDRQTLYAGLLKVVAIRFDACFVEGNSGCQKQIRLVWQPVQFNEGKSTTLDAAVHTFHAFDNAQFASLVGELKDLRSSETAASLSVHPALAREGYGARWEKLKSLVTKHCRRANLVRATAMTSNPRGVIWTFTGIDIVNGQFVKPPIPRVERPVQAFFASLQNPAGEFRARMEPEPAGEEAFLAVLKNSAEAKTRLTERELITATKSALILENPKLSNPGTVDCASCHGAHLVPNWSLRNFSWDWENNFARELFARLDPNAKSEPANVLRAFGYFKDRPIVSRRMQNESREAASKFNEEY